MIKYTIEAALGHSCSSLHMVQPHGCYASYIFHSLKDGVFAGIRYANGIRDHILAESIWVKPGDQVESFTGSNCTLGTAIMRFDSADQMLSLMDNMNRHLEVMVRD